MVPLVKRLSLVVVGVEHLGPKAGFASSGIALEGDEWLGAYRGDRLQVFPGRVAEIRRNLRDVEVAIRAVEKGREQRSVISVGSAIEKSFVGWDLVVSDTQEQIEKLKPELAKIKGKIEALERAIKVFRQAKENGWLPSLLGSDEKKNIPLERFDI